MGDARASGHLEEVSGRLMDVAADDVAAVRAAAAAFADRHIRQFAETMDRDEKPSPELFRLLRTAGYLTATVPVEDGGLGIGVRQAAAVAEEFARVDVTSATYFTGQCTATSLLLATATEEQRRMLTKDGPVMAISLSEPDVGSDVSSVKASAEPTDDGGYVLNGVKHYCTNGDLADRVVVLVRMGLDEQRGRPRLRVFALDQPTNGMNVTRAEKKMGLRGASLVELTFADCVVPRSCLLGTEPDAKRSLFSTMSRGRVTIGAVGVGLASSVLSLVRAQPGLPRSTRMELVDLDARLRATKALVNAAAVAVDSGHDQLVAMGASAKCAGTRLAVDAALWMMASLPGDVLTEHSVGGRMFRDAKILEIFDGTNEVLRVALARSVFARIG